MHFGIPFLWAKARFPIPAAKEGVVRIDRVVIGRGQAIIIRFFGHNRSVWPRRFDTYDKFDDQGLIDVRPRWLAL
jgi:hypothetical protein